jgi:hypothetical protein
MSRWEAELAEAVRDDHWPHLRVEIGGRRAECQKFPALGLPALVEAAPSGLARRRWADQPAGWILAEP